jgi:3-(3-hydroxy-phenyl)propionate hydroxylase
LDRAGDGMTAILFCEAQPTREQATLLAQLSRIDKRFVAVLVTSHGSAPDAKTIADQDGEIARLFAARPGTLYLLRPDLHIAGRWKAVVPGEILKTASLCLGSETP